MNATSRDNGIYNTYDTQRDLYDTDERMERMKRICCNPDCGWIGEEKDCLDWKHPTGARLCPECHEVTEQLYEEMQNAEPQND